MAEVEPATCSWRVPTTTGTGSLKIVATQDLGTLGPREGEPVEFQWHWYYNVPGLPQWILLLLMAVVLKRNRNWQAWLILLLPLALSFFWLLTFVLISDSSQWEMFGQFLNAVAIAWVSVWLMGPWILRGGRVRAFLGACAVMFAVGIVGYVSYFGFWVSSDITGPLIGLGAICLVPLIASATLTGWCYCGHFSPLQLLLWPMLWIPAVCLICVASFLGSWLQLTCVLVCRFSR